MTVTKGFVSAIGLLMLVAVFPGHSSSVMTQCGQDVVVSAVGLERVHVGLSFSQPMPNGASCSWLIQAENSNMSNQLLLSGSSNPNALSCGKDAFSVSERDPVSGAPTPITLECMDMSVNSYEQVVGRPGFPMVVALNTSSALTERFNFMIVSPFVWSAEVCPRTERKVIIARPGNERMNERLDPASDAHLISRFPSNMVCKWEFRSPDEGIVHLDVFSYGTGSGACSGDDYFLVRDGDDSLAPVKLPLCRNQGIDFQHASNTGSILVDMVSGSSGGAYEDFYFKYWSIKSCPIAPLEFRPYVKEKHQFKGSSFSTRGAGRNLQCRWRITARAQNIVKLYQLEAEDFQQNCDESKDYLLVNDRRISICNNSMFPIWSKDDTMDIVFHTTTQHDPRSFLLNFTAVYASPCQGSPDHVTVTGSTFESLMPIPQGDVGNGPLCQWIFTANDFGNAVQMGVDWEARGPGTKGVPFNKDSCSFAQFTVYNGDTANAAAEITPTCSSDKSTMFFKSTSRSMLLMYHRHDPESGFLMQLKEIEGGTGGGRSGRDVSGLLWKLALAGWFALVLVDVVVA